MRFARRTAFLGLLVGGLATLGTPGPAGAQHPPVVRGRVLEAGTGRPVSGALIQVVDGTTEAVSSADGSFLLRGLLPGTRTLRIQALGYASRTAAVEARNGRVALLRVELQVVPLDLPGVDATGWTRATLPPGALVLDSARIHESGARDLGELLSTVPGVTVLRRGGPGAPAGVSIRGSSADQVLVLVNGVPANSLLTGEADLSTLPVEGLDRVVVLRGGASSRFGGRALGGVVLLENETDPDPHLSARAGVESFGGRWATVEAGGEAAATGAREISGTLSATWRRTEGDFFYQRPRVRGGGETRRVNADASRLSFRGAGQWIPAGGGPRVRARLEVIELERGMPGPVAHPSTTGRQEQDRYAGVFTASDSEDERRWSLALQLQRQDARFRDPDPPLGPAFDRQTRVEGVGLVATGEGREAGLRWDGGVEARHHRIRAGSLAPEAPAGQSSVGAWAGVRFAGEIGDGWRVAGGPGLRVDWSSRLQGPWASPRLGGSLSRGPITWRLTLSSSFSPPALSDQFFQEGVLVRPNPDLRPERVRPEIEAGMDVEVGLGPGNVRLTAEAYRADIRDLILWLPDHRFVWSPRNADVTRRGGELRSRATFPGLALTLQGAVSWTRVEYAGPALDGQVVYRPDVSADLRLGWSPGALEGHLDARYTGIRRTVPGSSVNALGPFWIVDLRLGRTFRPGGVPLEARIRVDNVLDTRASILPDYPRPGRAFGLELRAHPFDSRPQE